MKAIVIFFPSCFLIGPDSHYQKFTRTLSCTHPNPFSLEALLWWQSPQLRNICNILRTWCSEKVISSLAQEGYTWIWLSRSQLITFFPAMTNLGRDFWSNSGHETWGEACWWSCREILYFSTSRLMHEIVTHRAVRSSYQPSRELAHMLIAKWKFF